MAHLVRGHAGEARELTGQNSSSLQQFIYSMYYLTAKQNSDATNGESIPYLTSSRTSSVHHTCCIQISDNTIDFLTQVSA